MTREGVRPAVHVVTSDGRETILHPGDLIGRSISAALKLDDIRVSEAHAYITLRAGQLRLLALRGMVVMDAAPTTEIELVPGQVIHFAEKISIGVSQVQLPSHLLAIEEASMGRVPLQGHAFSVRTKPRPHLEPRFVDRSRAYLWSDGDGWSVRVGDGALQELRDGSSFAVDGHHFLCTSVAMDELSSNSTVARGRLHPALRLVVHYDTASIERERAPPLGLGGLQARILGELVAFDGPVHWTHVASALWRDIDDEFKLRKRWDTNLCRLRQKLRGGDVRPDLIRADGTGQFELFLYPGDEVIDRM